MHIRWHPEAQLEAGEAARFYGERQSGLEQRFLDILEDALHRIRRRPQMYGIIYRTKPAAIEILAIMHLRRAPGYWKSRSR